jgi:hypothetical protein
VKGCKIWAYARHSGPLSREGSLSCHTCCDTGTRFFRSHPKDHSIQSPLTTHMGKQRTYSNPDPHGIIDNDFFKKLLCIIQIHFKYLPEFFFKYWRNTPVSNLWPFFFNFSDNFQNNINILFQTDKLNSLPLSLREYLTYIEKSPMLVKGCNKS